MPKRGKRYRASAQKIDADKKYELKEGSRLGPGPNDDKEGRVLNRIVRWEKEGLTYEADPRHY